MQVAPGNTNVDLQHLAENPPTASRAMARRHANARSGLSQSFHQLPEDPLHPQLAHDCLRSPFCCRSKSRKLQDFPTMCQVTSPKCEDCDTRCKHRYEVSWEHTRFATWVTLPCVLDLKRPAWCHSLVPRLLHERPRCKAPSSRVLPFAPQPWRDTLCRLKLPMCLHGLNSSIHDLLPMQLGVGNMHALVQGALNPRVVQYLTKLSHALHLLTQARVVDRSPPFTMCRLLLRLCNRPLEHPSRNKDAIAACMAPESRVLWTWQGPPIRGWRRPARGGRRRSNKRPADGRRPASGGCTGRNNKWSFESPWLCTVLHHHLIPGVRPAIGANPVIGKVPAEAGWRWRW